MNLLNHSIRKSTIYSLINSSKKSSSTSSLSICTNTQRNINYTSKKKIKSILKARESSEIDESTPKLFEHSDPLYRNDKIKSIDILKGNSRNRSFYPTVPIIDYTRISNEQFKALKRDQLILTALRQIELDVELFKNDIEKEGFLENLKDNLSINLKVLYNSGSNDNNNNNTDENLETKSEKKEKSNTEKKYPLTSANEFYYDNVLCGNFIEVEQLMDKPSLITFPTDNLDDSKMYTLMMVTTDYPYRIGPEGNFIHYLITNIKGNDISGGDCVLDYIPPLPTEYAGTFRYSFLIYEQSEHIDKEQLLNDFEQDKYKEVQEYRSVNEFSLELSKKSNQQKLKNFEAKKTFDKLMLKYSPYEREYMLQKKLEKENPQMEDSKGFTVEQLQYINKHEYVPEIPSESEKQKESMEMMNKRRLLDLETFLKGNAYSSCGKNGEYVLPKGMIFFRSEYDFVVSEWYKNMELAEPFYIPPDVSLTMKKDEETPSSRRNYRRNQWN